MSALKLQPFIQAGVCATLVAICVAGAGWLATQTAIGRENSPGASRGDVEHADVRNKLPEKTATESDTPRNVAHDQQIYRPGLRNSFVGRQLDETELNLTLTQLQRKTGFTGMRFDEAGFLTIGDRSQIRGGSAAARKLLLDAVDGKQSINLQSHNRSARVIFARVGASSKTICWSTNSQIAIAPIEIDFADFKHLRGDGEAVEAFDPGFAILHELCHVVLNLHDPTPGLEAPGDCESYVNRVRRELGMPERVQYAADVFQRTTFRFSPEFRVAELVFTQPEPVGEPGAKTKTFFLWWDTREVGYSGRRRK